MENRDKIVEVSLDVMRTIGQLDSSAESLSAELDQRIKDLTAKGEAATAEDKTQVEALLRVLEAIASQKLGLAIKNYDYIDHSIKAVDMEMALIEKALRDKGVEIPILAPMVTEAVDRKKRKKADDSSATSLSACSAEPVYCTCKRVAFGDMIACDNEDCPVEWFHYACVNLTRKPRNNWICPLCSNKRKK